MAAWSGGPSGTNRERSGRLLRLGPRTTRTRYAASTWFSVPTARATGSGTGGAARATFAAGWLHHVGDVRHHDLRSHAAKKTITAAAAVTPPGNGEQQFGVVAGSIGRMSCRPPVRPPCRSAIWQLRCGPGVPGARIRSGRTRYHSDIDADRSRPARLSHETVARQEVAC